MNRCIRNLLKFISVLQDNSTIDNCFKEGCLKSYLGPTLNYNCYNTRVISLYNSQGNLFNATYTLSGNIEVSSAFRIQYIQDDICCLLILRNDNGTYSSTGQYITINISCICAIKCLGDIQINNL